MAGLTASIRSIAPTQNELIVLLSALATLDFLNRPDYTDDTVFKSAMRGDIENSFEYLTDTARKAFDPKSDKGKALRNLVLQVGVTKLSLSVASMLAKSIGGSS